MTQRDDKKIAVINSARCMGCGNCAIKCPTDAIQLIQVREKEFIPA
jgi:NAD-dependent dihydropyrimidine dehydrogenase PreA subunit